MRVDLPDGQWAELLDPGDLRAGDLKAMRRHQVLGTTTTMAEVDTTRDVLLTRVVTAWSLDLPLPKDLPGSDDEAGSLDRLTIPTYQALVSAIDPHFDLISGEAGPDPKPSSESAGTSKASESTSTTSS